MSLNSPVIHSPALTSGLLLGSFAESLCPSLTRSRRKWLTQPDPVSVMGGKKVWIKHFMPIRKPAGWLGSACELLGL